MNPMDIIEKYYDKNSRAYEILVQHVLAVTKKALEIAEGVPELKPDLQFIEEAAMLHDIGVFKTDEPTIDCHGTEKYIRHGVLGREILEKEELPKHAPICERHTGVGISKEQIERENLPLPARDMIPLTVEEEIIALADSFFSKNAEDLTKEKDLETIRKGLAKFGQEKVEKFDSWCKKYKI
tara:strand:- start:1666 stop:2211 length:546 start_codon:yes stop_codon:yes gene_type:complete